MVKCDLPQNCHVLVHLSFPSPDFRATIDMLRCS